MSASTRSSNCWSSRISLQMRRLAAGRRASQTTMRSRSANARRMLRTQARMTILRLMRACRSISNGNSGTELSFSDIVSSCAVVRAECAGTIVGRGLKQLDGGSHTPRQHVTREFLTADEMSGLQPVLNVFEDFLEIFSKWYSTTHAGRLRQFCKKTPAARLQRWCARQLDRDNGSAAWYS